MGDSGGNTYPYGPVDCEISCVMTRFALWSPLLLPIFYVAFRRIRKEAKQRIPGLIKAVFLVESFTVCHTLSIWSNERSIIEFGTLVKAHTDAANSSFRYLRKEKGRSAEICSTKWKLNGLGSNVKWGPLDLRTVVATQHHTREGEVGSTVGIETHPCEVTNQ